MSSTPSRSSSGLSRSFGLDKSLGLGKSRYFFDFHDGVSTFDEIGLELDSLEAARAEAIQTLAAVAVDAAATASSEYLMTVRDKTGRTRLCLRMSYDIRET